VARPKKAGDQVQQRRFARSRAADDRHVLACADCARKSAQDCGMTVPERDLAELDFACNVRLRANTHRTLNVGRGNESLNSNYWRLRRTIVHWRSGVGNISLRMSRAQDALGSPARMSQLGAFDSL
jgi:hypothetical protein